jgi:hypothetical protein
VNSSQSLKGPKVPSNMGLVSPASTAPSTIKMHSFTLYCMLSVPFLLSTALAKNPIFTCVADNILRDLRNNDISQIASSFCSTYIRMSFPSVRPVCHCVADFLQIGTTTTVFPTASLTISTTTSTTLPDAQTTVSTTSVIVATNTVDFDFTSPDVQTTT